MGLGGLLAGAVVVGTLVGYALDDAMGTTPVLTLVGVFVGIAAGGLGFWARVRSALRT